MLRSYLITLFCKKKIDDDEIFIKMTYRSDIVSLLPTTYYTSDKGWGCMLRVGQMVIANLFYKNKHSKQAIQFPQVSKIMKLFYDNILVPFSIQYMTKISKLIYPLKQQQQWYTPCQCGFIIKQLLQNFDGMYRVSICNDNSIFLQDIQIDRPFILVIIMCRIGLQKPQNEKLKCIIEMTKLKHFNCIMGGLPTRALYIPKYRDGCWGYLDPHSIRKATKDYYSEQKQQKNLSKLEWIDCTLIDTSMNVCFALRAEQVNQFWSDLQKLKIQLGKDFFFLLEKNKPQEEIQEIVYLNF